MLATPLTNPIRSSRLNGEKLAAPLAMPVRSSWLNGVQLATPLTMPECWLNGEQLATPLTMPHCWLNGGEESDTKVDTTLQNIPKVLQTSIYAARCQQQRIQRPINERSFDEKAALIFCFEPTRSDRVEG